MSMEIMNSFISEENEHKCESFSKIEHWINEFCLSNLEINHISHGNEDGRYNTFKHMIKKDETLLKQIPHESHHNSCKLCLLVPARNHKIH